jgi:hypothetical protein
METSFRGHRVPTLLAVAAVALLVSPVLAADRLPNSRAKMTSAEIAQQASQRTLGYRACSLCYTCGGPWPYLAGTFYTPRPGDTFERGNSCAGGLAYRYDTNPRVCCGVDQ